MSHNCHSNTRSLQHGDKLLPSLPGAGEGYVSISRICCTFLWPLSLPWSSHRMQIDIIPTFLWYLLPQSWCEGFFNMNSVKGETYYCKETLLCRAMYKQMRRMARHAPKRDWKLLILSRLSTLPFKQPPFFWAINTKFFLVKWSAFMLPERGFWSWSGPTQKRGSAGPNQLGKQTWSMFFPHGLTRWPPYHSVKNQINFPHDKQLK